MAQASEKFTSVSDLYKRILPALNAKVAEIKREKINYIENIDIWNYCVEYKWKQRKDLRIYEMVSDIFSVDALNLSRYIRMMKNER